MDTRIESSGPSEFVGVAVYGDPGGDIADCAWKLFGEVADDAGISRVGRDIFGLQIYHPGFPEHSLLTYMACVKKPSDMAVPARMVAKSLPACEYVVATVGGGVADIDTTLIYLYREYVPKNGLRVAMPIDFERYLNVRDHESLPDHLELWVPVSEA